MKYKKILFQTIVLLGLFALAFSFNGNSIRENYNVSTENLLANDSVPGDTTYTEDPQATSVFYSQDLSSSFNERGYFKSNSFNSNGEEIVNDFNGNLCYRIPIASGKGPGDLSYDFSINYNGNVNYQILSSYYATPAVYNFSAPGWIFSINGLAVQMVNFESGLFSRPDIDGNVSGREVCLQPSGYSITRMLTSATGSNHDRITILLGDGSTETVENEIGFVDTGNYYSTSKNDFIRARVEYYDQTPYKLRIMYLMKGDGLTYIYNEIKSSYYGDNNQNVPLNYVPNTFLLNTIKDKFGNDYYLGYDNLEYGRPRLSYVPFADFTYYTDGLISVNVNGVGLYKFITDPYSYDKGQEHRPKLKQIVNPSGEVMSFAYESYTREGNNLRNSTNQIGMSIFFTNWPLFRLSEVKNFDGGTKNYFYGGRSLQLDYFYNASEAGAHSDEAHYFGQGRDMFFSNMVDSIKNSSDNILLNKISYSYNYDAGRNWADVFQYPINSNDEYYTTKTVESKNDDNTNNTPSWYQTKKLYRNYRIRMIENAEIADFVGIMRLTEEKFYVEGEQFEYKQVNQFYSKGTSNSYTDVYNGTFLDSIRVEKNKDEGNNWCERKWQYFYTGGGALPLNMKTEIDPLGTETITYFQNFYKKYRVFKYGVYKPSDLKYDSVYFYLIHMPDSIIVKKGTNILQKKEITYYNPDDVTESNIVPGYPGQIHEEKDLYPVTNITIKSNSYLYYNKDTTGSYLWPGNTYNNSIEGCLKEITDANGGKTKYYYDIISDSEDEQYTSGSRKLSYHKIKDSGTELVESTDWSDARFPTRIDNYVSNDRYLSHYQQYNEIGNPTMVVNENKFMSQVDYDNYHRLKCLTLPYDFNDSLPDTTYVINTRIVPVTINTNSIGYGYKDEVSNYFRRIYDTPEGTGIDINYTLHVPDHPSDIKIKDLIQFNRYEIAQTIDGIDSAFFIFYPFYIISKLDGSPIDYNFYIKPLDTLFSSQQGENFVTHYTSGIGIANCGNLNHRDSTSCWGPGINYFVSQYSHYKKSLDVSNIMTSNLDATKRLIILQGLELGMSYTGNEETGVLEFKMPTINISCNEYPDTWKGRFRPRLEIHGYKYMYDTIKTIHYKNGSLIYSYNDRDNIVTVSSKIDKSGSNYRFKTVDNYFDGFGRLKQTKIHLPNDSAFYYSYYNYLGQKAKSTDALNHSTKFSYDKYGGLSETENADQTENLVSNTYQSSINTTFYDVSNGCFNKQVYTDETGRHFEKYYDAVGKLIREVKYVLFDNSTPDNPLDIDTSTYVPDNETLIPLYTDYCYDDLYRVTQVRTPANKRIYYSYDALGRQSSRTTPDDGLTKYIYDKNNNLLFSQDANQRSRGTNIYTFRNYDGLNRLLSLGETQIGSPNPIFETLDTSEADFVGYNNEMLTVNVYDSLAYGSDSIFSNVPTDYHVAGVRNNTKGALVATAYKTNLSDSWSYKFYRYDARGRVIKMWNYIDGLGWKTMLYNYNSQNQVTYLNYRPSFNDNKLFRYLYDSTARLMDVSIYSDIASEEMEEDYTGTFTSFSSYSYNRNSQVLHYKFNNYSNDYQYDYNNRNWITGFGSQYYPSEFTYILTYLPNGNIRNSIRTSDTIYPFSDHTNLQYTYIYDKSNRLLKADQTFGSSVNTFDAVMSYDNDGNTLSLKRYGSNENIIDNLTYSYYVNNNKINRVSGQDAQYTYDAVGNMTGDTRDPDDVKQDLKYDHRNLLTGMRVVRKSVGGDGYETYQLMYNYDEAGNRVRKRVYFYQGEDPTPVFEEDDMTGSWDLVGDEYYVRDVSGKEIAVYHSSNLEHWNVWGTDNVGKINSNGSKFFYIKDHLGSVRVVLNSDNQIVSAIDYDCWGYPLENRSYQSDDIDYKFTGKQRDAETGYDYFGARYYDARIGRWGGVEPLLEKYISYSPYQYGLLNPMRLVDADGKDVYIFGSDSKATVEYMNKESESTGLTFSIDDNGKLSVTGKPQDKNANLLYYAITDENIKIGLFTVRSDIATFGGVDFIMSVGTYLGNFSLNGDKIAIQYFNLPQAIAYNKAEGSSVGVSAFHEIKESLYGAICYPGSDGYTKAHKLTVKSDPKIPDPFQVYDRTNKKYFYVKNEDKENAATAERFYPKY